MFITPVLIPLLVSFVVVLLPPSLFLLLCFLSSLASSVGRVRGFHPPPALPLPDTLKPSGLMEMAGYRTSMPGVFFLRLVFFFLYSLGSRLGSNGGCMEGGALLCFGQWMLGGLILHCTAVALVGINWVWVVGFPVFSPPLFFSFPLLWFPSCLGLIWLGWVWLGFVSTGRGHAHEERGVCCWVLFRSCV